MRFFTSRHPAVFLARWLVFFVFLTTVVGMIFEDRFIYHPARDGPYDRKLDFPLTFHSLTAADGIKLEGCHSAVAGARGTVLWLHGNGGNIAYCLDGISELRSLGVSVFVVDYRGYGRSEGSPSEEGLYLDAEAAYRFMVERLGVPPSRIVILGRSLGGAPAIHLASKVDCAGLVVQSTFTSARAMAPVRMPYLPWLWLAVRTDFPNEERIAEVRAPKLIIHSRDDESIPFRMGRALHDAAPEPKEFFELSGFRHDDPRLRQSPEYHARLRAFFDRVLPRQ
jgi:hypothetical protein